MVEDFFVVFTLCRVHCSFFVLLGFMLYLYLLVMLLMRTPCPRIVITVFFTINGLFTNFKWGKSEIWVIKNGFVFPGFSGIGFRMIPNVLVNTGEVRK